MLRPQKKISKKEMKEDALITFYGRATRFYETYRKNISIGIISIVILIAAALIYLKNRADNDESAATQLGQIFQYYDNGQLQIAIDGIPERNVPGLKSIVENFGNSNSGNIARFYLADAYSQLGRVQDALDQYDAMSGSIELIEVSRLAGMAGCYESLGKYAEAARYYEKAASANAKGAGAAENLDHAARNYRLVGEKEKAVELYKKLKKNYPASPYAREADRHIAELSV